MKFISLFGILLSLNAWSVVQCELFDNEQLSSLTSLSVPNCLTEDNIYSELETNGSSNSGGVICNNCKQQLNARVEVSNADKIKLRKQAYLETMFSEYKKSMAVLVSDMVSLRKLYSTGASLEKSKSKCSAQNFQQKVRSCSPFAKQFFENNNVTSLIPNELASLFSNQNIQPALLKRGGANQCSISDQEIISLKPLLFERLMTPELARTISELNPTSTVDLWSKLLALSNTSNIIDLIKHHPILSSLANNPSAFIAVFRQASSTRPGTTFDKHFRNILYSQSNGEKFDETTAARCEQAMASLTSKVCSADFENGDISLGPIDGFERYNNDRNYPEGEAVTSEENLGRNVTLLEFCTPISQGKLSLAKDANSINEWMSSNERKKTYNSFSSYKHKDLYETPRNSLCADLNSNRCSNEVATNDFNCKLVNLYRESKTSGTEAFKLSNNPDAGVNNVLRSLAGNPQGLPEQTKQVLIAEGILPQSNGQFVERPQIPERQPEYLAGVANGTITPNVPSSSAVQSQATRSPNRNSQAQAQTQVFQPGQGNSAVSETQIAANSEDDSEALRRFEDGLDDRLRRVEGQQPTGATRSATPARRQASRADSSGRTNNQSQSAEFIPTQSDAPSQISGASSAVSAVVPEARLGQDTSRRGLADRQRNDALANMSGARTNPSATPEAGRNPASEEVPFRPEASLTLNIASGANLERFLASNENLKALIQEQKPFRFKLNNNVFDVQFKDGNYTVSFRSGANNGRTVATTLQGIFNNSLKRSPSADRNATLESLGNTLRN